MRYVRLQATFYAFHWALGSPDSTFQFQGQWDGQTFWEQLDEGAPWTNTKKFLFVVPTIL
jgi:hypothetical protein